MHAAALLTVAALFAVWANVHGSWPVGGVAIGAELLGDLVTNRRRWRSLLAIGLAAACGVMLNPAGPLIWRDVLTVAANPGIGDLIEWQPLARTPRQGLATLVVIEIAVGLAAAARFRGRVADWGLLVLLAVLTVRTSRWIVWLAPVAGIVLADSLARVTAGAGGFRRLRGWTLPRAAAAVVAAISLLAAMMTWPPRARLSPLTPRAAVAHLTATDRRGLVFNNQLFGDALLWFGPADTRPFVHSHVHLVPADVWRDYRTIRREPAAAGPLLDRYGCDTLLLMRFGDARLYDRLRESGRWQLTYADRLAVVLIRRDDPRRDDRTWDERR